MKAILIPAMLFFINYTYATSVNDSSLINNLKSKIEEIEFDNSNQFMSSTYCYYIFQRIINIDEITPKLFSKFIKGGSLSLKYAQEYVDWLKTKEGLQCKAKVGPTFSIFSVPKNKTFAIFLNTPVIIKEGKDTLITKSHERLHIAFALYKDQQHKVEEKWDLLSVNEKKEFRDKHPGYNFKKKKTLLKEFFAYTYERDLGAGLKLLTSKP